MNGTPFSHYQSSSPRASRPTTFSTFCALMFFTSSENTANEQRISTEAYTGSARHAPVASNTKPRKMGVTVWADMLAV